MYMKYILGFLVCFILMLSTCTQTKVKPVPVANPQAPFTLEEVAFIPLPLEIAGDSGSFALSKHTKFRISNANSELKNIRQYLLFEMHEKTGINFADDQGKAPTTTFVELRLQKNAITDSPEAYQLKITRDSLQVKAATYEGIFRGVQTVLQIVPEFNNLQTNDSLTSILLPLGSIKDKPAFSWRGTMLDVARHFFTVDEVKQYIKILAAYKINRLHLHLSDDQGWRIAIDTYPKLTEIGGKTEVGGTPGGFYTKADYKELVAFAARHYITIIPEIDMPGHTNAASVAYPFLNGTGKTVKPYTGMKVGFSSFNTKKDTVYSFIQAVISEISNLTPAPYFHIGGDESHSTKNKDYRYFVKRVEKLVEKSGKQMIGWDEIVNAAEDTTSIVQFWNNSENAEKAAQKGMKVILSPAKKAYLDMKYDSISKHGLTWAGTIPVDSAYNWQPETYAGIPLKNILGIEAPLWSETISDLSELEYLAFPRIIGYAELGWTPAKHRNWLSYKKRLARHAIFLNRKKVNYYKSPLINWAE